MFFYFKWYIKRRTSASELLAEYRTEVYRLIADIDSATDRDSRLVEDRIKQLRTILEDADKRVAIYARELEKSRAGEALYTSLGRGIRAALKTPAEPSAQSAQPAQTPTSVQPPSSPQQLTLLQSEKPPSKRQIRAQIETMTKDGLSPGEIASQLGISLAEVDLAINLQGIEKS